MMNGGEVFPSQVCNAKLLVNMFKRTQWNFLLYQLHIKSLNLYFNFHVLLTAFKYQYMGIIRNKDISGDVLPSSEGN